MTPTEKLIAEARELDRMATPGPWKVDKQGRYCDHDECYVELADDSMTINNFIVEGCRYENAEFIAQSRTLIPALCDALEQAQSTLEQTWEWDMYKAAQKEIERLRKELADLASESVKRDIALAKLEAEVTAAIEAQNSQRWIPVSERLPNEEDGLVLALVNGNPRENITLHNAYMLAEHSVAEGWIVSEYPEWEDAQVTHWQPLPQPPKGED